MRAVFRSRLGWLGAIAVVGLGAGTLSLIGAARAGPPPDRLELLRLLQERNFDRLEIHLKGYRDDTRAAKISDRVLAQAYHSFASANPELEPDLEAWIAASPESYAARMARAFYFRHLGFVSRGAASARRTPNERFVAMRAYFARASADLAAAAAIDPRLGLTYGSLIHIAMVRGDEAETDLLVRKGLAADPRSFTIRRRYLYSLTPWWRSNQRRHGFWNLTRDLASKFLKRHELIEPPKAIRQFVAEVESDAVNNPALAPFKGYGDYVIADLLGRRGFRKEAVGYYERALRFGGYWWYLDRQGYNYYRLGRYRDAVASYTRALEIWPQVPDTLDSRARSRRKMKQFDRAFADWDLALSLDPGNPEILLQLAYALRQVGRHDDVLSTLDRALLYGAHDQDVRDARGRILLYELRRPGDAIADLRRATELNPGRKKYWYNYGLALYRVKDCKAAQALVTYRKLCAAGAKCAKKKRAWAAKVIHYQQSPGHCPVQHTQKN